VTPERIPHDVEELKSRLRTFSRLASSLRNAKVRDAGQIKAVELEIDMLRAKLGYSAQDIGILFARNVVEQAYAMVSREAA
jgi:chromosome condensin MukBEF ATPase and DNA-binding subunit MukB